MLESGYKCPLFRFGTMKELESILKKILDQDLVLLESKFDPVTGRWVVIVDSETGITLDRTSDLARKIMNDPEINSVYPDGLRVEVSSPGIGYPLTQLFQFKKNIGRRLQMELDDKWMEVPREVTLDDIQDDILHVSHRKKSFSIPFQDVKQARVLISFH